jgi:hypothetical protein
MDYPGRHFWFVFIALVTLLGGATPVSAQVFGGFDRAAMPGPVIEGHAKWEDECSKCHQPFKRDLQNVLCLDCHEKIRADVDDKAGFHGRLKDIKTRPCKVCHTDHIGRDAVIVLLDKATFVHDQTDFPLNDSHVVVPCEGCHEPDKMWREAPGKCIDCHEDESPHKGKLGKKCDICHAETKWTDFFFDHSKTDFGLLGKHVGVSCGDCHVGERYKGIPKKCYACHRSDDKHRGDYGEKCEDCHSEYGWHDIGFDHDKDTDYKLKDKHRVVTCGQCHGDDIYEELETDCYSCHKFRDSHKGLYGKKCEDCHSEKGWPEIHFDHDDDTEYKLKGKHKDVGCIDCHPGELYEDETPTKCYDCHRQDDVHDGQEGKKCDKCHSEEGWIQEVDFDHDLTDFPLLGAHATVACEECHISTSFKDVKKKCITCHEADDVHEKRQGPHCEICHNGSDWKLWIFDHNRQTEFKLDGAHEDLHCDLCHKEEVEDIIETDSDCYSCHSQDDVHNGSYGRICDRCHVTSSFEDFSPGWR